LKIDSIFVGAIHFFVVLLLFFVGALFIGFFLAPTIFLFFVEVLNRPEVFLVIGGLCTVLSCVLFCGFYSVYRYRYLKIKINPQIAKESCVCEVDGFIIEEYAKRCFEKILKKEVKVEVYLTKKTLEIVVYLNLQTKIDKKQFIEEAKKELTEVLAKNLSYEKSFFLTLKAF